MSTTTAPSEPVIEAQRVIFGVLQPYQKDTAIMQRIQAFVVLKTGKKLTEFLNNGASDEEKLALLSELTTIVNEKNWQLLPAAAVGQASTPSAAAPKRAATPLLKKAEPVAATPVMDALMTPAATEHRPPATPKATDLLAAAIAAMQAESEQKEVPAPALTEAEIRKIARAELADVFEKIVGVLRQ